MIFHLIATVVVGFGSAGIALLIRRFLGRDQYRWLIPAFAGAGMIGYAIFNDYAWAAHSQSTLPDGVIVAAEYPESSFLQPWTYLAPAVQRYAAIDTNSAERLPEAENVVFARVWLFGRWSDPASGPMMFDCAGNRRAALDPDVPLDAKGLPPAEMWTNVEVSDPLLSTMCDAGID